MDLRSLKERIDALPLKTMRLGRDGGVLKNIPAFKQLVESLADLPPFSELAENIRGSPLYPVGAEAFSFPEDQAKALHLTAEEFYLMALGLQRALVELVPAVRPETVVASISEQNDLSSVIDILGELRKSLLQLVTEDGIGGEVEVERWETGSLLVFLWLKTAAAVDLVARALRSAAIVYQEIQKGRILGQHVNLLKEHVRKEKIKNDLAEVLQEAQEKMIGTIVDREARAVEADTFDGHDNERLERIKNSVRLLADLFDKGTTVYPVLEMPKDQREKFPDFKKLESTFSSIKQLEGATDSPQKDSASGNGDDDGTAV
jgi:hypothetical protein